jgi:hypothetical protein
MVSLLDGPIADVSQELMVKHPGTVMTDAPDCRFDQVNVTVTLKRNLPLRS